MVNFIVFVVTVAELESKLSSTQQQLEEQSQNNIELLAEMNSLREELEELRAQNYHLKVESVRGDIEVEAEQVTSEQGDVNCLVKDEEAEVWLKAQLEQYRAAAETARINMENLCSENESLKCRLQQSLDEVQCMKHKLEDVTTELELSKRQSLIEAKAVNVTCRRACTAAVDTSSYEVKVNRPSADITCSVEDTGPIDSPNCEGARITDTSAAMSSKEAGIVRDDSTNCEAKLEDAANNTDSSELVAEFFLTTGVVYFLFSVFLNEIVWYC